MDEEVYTSDRRLYLDADKNVVEAGDPARQTLLVGKGGTLAMERAREYGLVEGEKAEAASRKTAAGDEGEAAQPVEGQPTPGADDKASEAPSDTSAETVSAKAPAKRSAAKKSAAKKK